MKILSPSFLQFAVFLTGLSAGFSQTIPTSADATLLRNGNVGTTGAGSSDGEDNFGGRTEVIIGASGANPRSGLFRFDVSGLETDIDSSRVVAAATLRLFERAGRDELNGSNSADFQAFALVSENGGWVEGTSAGSAAGYSAEAGSVSLSYLASPSVFGAEDGLRWFSQGGGATETSGVPFPRTFQVGADTGEAVGTTVFTFAEGAADVIEISLDAEAVRALLPEWLEAGAMNAGLLVEASGTNQLFIESIEGASGVAGEATAAELEIVFQAVDPGDTDMDGLLDTVETNGGPGSYVDATNTGTDPALADTDGDGIPDGDEIDVTVGRDVFTDPTLADTDADMIDDNDEFALGTDPNSADTDEDTISDGAEVALGINPLLKDSDMDGVDDNVEINTDMTDPALADSDSDAFSDGEEKLAGTDPNDANERPALSPVAYWPMDQDSGTETVDVLGNVVATWANIDAANSTPTNLVWSADGRIGGAADLQGTTDNDGNFFEVDTLAALAADGATGLTISVWIRPDLQGDVSYNGVFMTRQEGSADTNYGIAFESTGRNADYRAAGLALDSAGGSVLRSADGEFGADENWYHLAMTVDLATQTETAYLNGELVGSAVRDGILDLDGEGYRIGADGSTQNDNRDFDGLIDDLAIFDRSVSASTVAALYRGGVEARSAASVLGFAVPGADGGPRISSVTVVGNDVVLTFPEPAAGMVYEIRSSLDLTVPFDSWTLLNSDEDGMSYTDIGGASGDLRRFYRLKVVEAP